MSLTAGTRVGVYEIGASIGAGGMGEVYRARDTKLGRSVAVKVLPDPFVLDPERIARFQREARALAALNHPHIATLYGMEEWGGEHLLVMELVEGETLAERLQRGAVPLEEALQLARQIAEALEAAHEKGIVHRDLKPANVKITPDDQVKVLDFGLAKAMETESPGGAQMTNSPTFSMMGTQAGVILGTAAYMSPEQAKGFATDHRSDIFSFGVVLYEMLTGRQPFQGETISDILASILARDPDVDALPPSLNPRLIDLVRRCLEKHPRRRWQAIGDVRVELETIAASPRALPAAAHAIAAPRRPLWRRASPAASAALLASALTGAAMWSLRPTIAPTVTRFSIILGEKDVFTTTNRRVVSISPDGGSIVYVANRQLYVRAMSDLQARPIVGTDTMRSVANPVFSPDGRSIAFWSLADQAIKRISTSGGATVTICTVDTPTGMIWDRDSLIFGLGNDGVMRVSANGGEPEALVRLKAGESAHGPQLLQDGKWVLFTLASGVDANRWDQAKIVVQSLSSGERRTLVGGGTDGRVLPTGHLVYALAGTIFALRFDEQTLSVSGGPVPVLEGVRRTVGATAAAHFALSDAGTLVYVPGPTTSSAQLSVALFDREGAVEPLKIRPGPYQQPRLSPDGTRVAFGSDDGKDAVIWIYDLSAASSVRRLTFEGRNRYPVWSSDSRRVTFQSDRQGDGGIFWQPADGTGTAERLTRPDRAVSHVPQSWAPGGERLLFDVIDNSKISLSVLSLRDGKVTPFDAVQTSVSTGAVFSPDGQWVAYTRRDAGRPAIVYTQPSTPTGAKFQISKDSEDGHHPVWSRDGKELFYTPGPGNQIFAVSIVTKPSFAFGEARSVTRVFTNAAPTSERTYDITRDGRRFLGLTESLQTQAGAPSAPQFQVVLNWFEELKSRVPVGR